MSDAKVEIFKPEPLVSNLYTRIEDVRQDGIAPESEDDAKYAYWSKKIVHPVARLSDESLRKLIYEQSRELDNVTDYWFYPQALRLPYAYSDLYDNEIWLPAPVISEELEVFFIVDGLSYQLKKNEFEVFSRTQDDKNPRVVLDPHYVMHNDFTGDPWVKGIRYYEWDSSYERYQWYKSFWSQKKQIVVVGEFGFIEDGGVPVPLQKVCRWLVKKEAERLADPVDGDDYFRRSLITKENTDGHSYELSTPKDLADYRGGFLWTGEHWVDSIVAKYVRIVPFRMEVV